MRFYSLLVTVFALNIFAYLSIRLRPRLFKVALFKPMIWNFKLSLLPMGILLATNALFLVLMYINSLTAWSIVVYLGYIVLLGGLVLWILMLPNSGYLITELNMTHRIDDIHEVPIWYDIVSILSFAMSGIANTLVNIVMVQLMFLVGVDPANLTKGDFTSFIITALIINTLVAIGVYLGRQIRFNSWDVMHPMSFVKKLRAHFKTSRVVGEFILFVVMHTTFFMIMYYAFGIPNLFL